MQIFVCAVLLLSFFASSAPATSRVPERHFTFHYSFRVRNTHPGMRLRVWIPLAHSNEFQEVRMISQKADLALRQTHENEYGNEMLYAETAKTDKDEYAFDLIYDVIRRQNSGGGAALKPAEFKRLLAPDRLVPTTGLPAELAAKQVSQVTGGDYE